MLRISLSLAAVVLPSATSTEPKVFIWPTPSPVIVSIPVRLLDRSIGDREAGAADRGAGAGRDRREGRRNRADMAGIVDQRGDADSLCREVREVAGLDDGVLER